MAERGPLSADHDHQHEHEADILGRDPANNNNIYKDENDNSTSKSETTTNSNGFVRVHATYVVQVPKDQIYRVPPPENAAIAERRRNPAKNDNKKIRPCASRCCCCLLFLAVLVFALSLMAIFLTAYFYKDPNFYVDRIIVFYNGADHDHYRLRDARACSVTLRSENTNDKVDLSYREGGVVSLWFRDREIGAGEFPAFYQEHEKSMVFDLVLRGKSADAVDRVMKEIVNNKQRATNVKLSLKMENITARTERFGTWIRRTVKYAVACDVTVDSFARVARVLSQECRTTREV